MLYYYQEVLPLCQAGIFLPFRDGKWGAGVFGEAEFFLKKGQLVYQITHLGAVTPIIDLEEIHPISIAETRQCTALPY